MTFHKTEHRLIKLSVQFCGTSPSEPPFLNIYLNMFHQVPSPKSILFIHMNLVFSFVERHLMNLLF
jgi:hypothetical protein